MLDDAVSTGVISSNEEIARRKNVLVVFCRECRHYQNRGGDFCGFYGAKIAPGVAEARVGCRHYK